MNRVLVKLGLPLGCFQKTRATLPVAVFRKLLAADGSGVLPLRKTTSHGATDEFGFKAQHNVITPHDFHATILHLFGRMPTFQKGASGRDHNPSGFTCWFAGAGVKKGHSYGATDPFGWKAEQNPVTVHALHATALHLLGLDHERLSYRQNGTERRLTDVHGHVIKAVLS